MVGIMDATAGVWSKIAQKKLLFQPKVNIFNHSGDRPENASSNQTHEILELKKDRDDGPNKEVTKEEVNSRAVKFSTSRTRIQTYNAEIEHRSLIWYKPADLKQFKEDRLIDTFKIMNKKNGKNDEEVCWWGLERLIVPCVGSKAMRAREIMKQVVLRKQDEAYLDRQFKEASEWAAQAAKEKALYYYSHLYDNGLGGR
ncbi:hypothetical protein ACHAWT_007895 [Skeletonema menzelii]